MSEPTVYGDWGKDRQGWFLGLNGPQLSIVVAAGLPALLAMGASNWWFFLAWLPVWAVIVALTVLPVRGRPAFRWLADVVTSTLGALMGWTPFSSRAAEGTADDLSKADLPGDLAGLAFFDGPPFEVSGLRPAIIQNHAARTWAVTARVEHPGIGLSEQNERTNMGSGLAELSEIAARTELLGLFSLQIRTMPDTGTARTAWRDEHARPDAPALAVDNDRYVAAATAGAGVQHESFATFVVAERDIRRGSREAGGGVDGRARVLYSVMREVEAQLRGRIGCTSVEWLDAGAMADAIRVGFAPADAVSLTSAQQARRRGQTDVADHQPLAAAGPSRAPTSPARHYVHDAWSTVSCTVLLPDQGAIIGALAPVFTPTAIGERRSVTVFFEPLSRRTAEKVTGRAEMSAVTGNELARRGGFRIGARKRNETRRIGSQDEKLARGRSLVRTAIAVAVTVPSEWSASEYGRRLESSVRTAGFTPLRLDLAQPSGFVAACIPVGIGMPRRRGGR